MISLAGKDCGFHEDDGREPDRMEISWIVRKAVEVFKTPFLLMDLSIVRGNYRRLKKSLPDGEIFYAVKANSHPRIVNALKDEGASFDVASKGEMVKLLELGVEPEKMSFGNTIKKVEDIEFAYSVGVPLFAADAEMELEKIARYAPHSTVYLRLAVEQSNSDWPLSRKFGTSAEHVVRLAKYGASLGLDVAGVSFHVGSQSYDPGAWCRAIEQSAWIFKQCRKIGINMYLLNVGGGMPVKHTKPIPSIEDIMDVIKRSVEENLYFVDNLKLMVEPGRSMVGDAGIMVAKVLLRSQKPSTGEEWVYIDVGVFHGLMETIEGFQYEIVVDGKETEKKKSFILAGPTCDSVDKISDDVLLPESVTYGDVIYILNAGAYTVEYASHFNGMLGPSVHFVDELTKIMAQGSDEKVISLEDVY